MYKYLSISKYVLSAVFLSALFVATPAFAFERLVYFTNTKAAQMSFAKHANDISIFAPQVYTLSLDGTISGEIPTEAARIIKEKGVATMPLLMNQDFKKSIATKLMTDMALQGKVVTFLTSEAVSKGYIGWQFDLEHVPSVYKENFTAFVQRTKEAFSAKGLLLSIAVVAKTSDTPGDYPAGYWDDWAGAYDYEALAKSVDFLSVMTYDDPGSKGPVARIEWVKTVIQYALQKAPKEKISLGIPFYAWHWTGTSHKKLGMVSSTIPYTKYAKKQYTQKGYSKTYDALWMKYKKNGKYYFIWYENNDTIAHKIALAKEYGLRGVSVWAFGLENDSFWQGLMQ